MMNQSRGRAIVVSIVALFSFASSAGNAQTLMPVDRVAVFDANGTRVGRLLGFDDKNGTGQLAFKVDGHLIVVTVRRDRIRGNTDAVIFESSDCTLGPGETPFLPTPTAGHLQPVLLVAGTTVYLEDPNGIPQTVFWNSSLDEASTCAPQASTQVGSFVPALQLSIPAFTPPFTLGPDVGEGDEDEEEEEDD